MVEMKTSELEIFTPNRPDQQPTPEQPESLHLAQTESLPLEVTRYVEGMAPPEYARLIVLVPDRDVDETALARKVWALLNRRRVSILLISLVTDSYYGPSAQRRLVTLAALTQDKFYTIETRLIFGHSWIQGLEEIVQPGDLIICHDSQQTRSLFHKALPLSELVLSRLHTPIYLLSGLYPETITPRPSRILRQVVLWGLLIGILGGFFVFEADIDHLTAGWISTLLFILVFSVEILLIWMWNFLRI
jgi:hypothetical protein